MAASAIKALEALGLRAGDACAPAQVTEEDFATADRVMALKRDEHLPLQDRFPARAEKVEFWHVDDAPEALGLLEREVMALVAHILGGGTRQENQPTESVRYGPISRKRSKLIVQVFLLPNCYPVSEELPQNFRQDILIE